MSWLILDVVRHAFGFEPAATTPYTFATGFIPVFLSYYGMAVLVQLPGTCHLRTSLLPVVFWLTARANSSLDLSFGYSGLAYLNQGLALGMFTIAMRSAAWVFAPKPYARYPLHKPGEETTNGHDDTTTTDTVSFRSATWNAWDLTINLRGIGWNWQGNTHIPKPYFQITSRPIFLLYTLCRLLFFAVIFDIFSTLVRSLGPTTFGTPTGGTIFDPSLRPIQRYLRSSLIALLFNFTIYLLVETIYHLETLAFTLLFHHHPSQWPPVFDAPWFSTSIADFWGRRWQQIFREYFVAVGGNAFVRRWFGKAGIVLGAFTISGIFHDIGIRGMGRGGDTFRVVGYFLMQAVGIILEVVWKLVMGKRLGGFARWVWMVVWLTGTGNVMVDAWAKSGFIGSEFFPEGYGPGRVVLGWLGYEISDMISLVSDIIKTG